MSEVTDAIAVARGTLYGDAESKEAFLMGGRITVAAQPALEWAVERAQGEDARSELRELFHPDEARETTLALLVRGLVAPPGAT